jgi:hypothetical protein
MTNDAGNLSIDFLVGVTIFILAFIWIATMIPGLFLGLQAYTIDYDAVAYRTGVILVEDPGWPASPPWETYDDLQTSNVTRFGLAISKETPNILGQDKVNRFFCTTAFLYPEDYQQRAIFGDHPYHFNISLLDIGMNQTRSVGDIVPDGYGYIRRIVKIKGTSNATIGINNINAHHYISAENVTRHEFSILINNTKLLGDVKDPSYQIDPSREQIMVNITDINKTVLYEPMDSVSATLTVINVYKLDAGVLSLVRTFDRPYLDDNSTITLPPATVNKTVTLKFNPQFFEIMQAGYSQIYINLTFDLDRPSTFLNNTPGIPFDYNYDPVNVTQPYLRDGIVEVAVW